VSAPRARERRSRLAIAVAIAAAAFAGFSYGVLCHWLELWPHASLQVAFARFSGRSGGGAGDDRPRGSWHVADREPGAERDKLAALGYLSAYETSTSARGVTLFDRERAQDGLNLFTSGHAPTAFLLTMDGRVVHEWHHDYIDAFPGGARGGKSSSSNWRRAHLFENGDLLAIYDYVGLVKVDRASRLLWSNPRRFHHDVDLFDGMIYAITEEHHVLPRVDDEPVREDFITILDSAGKVVRKVSVLAAFERSRYAPLLRDESARVPDILHTNTIEVLDGSQVERSAVFKRGNVLISVLALDTVAIVDMERERVSWALSGLWARQHQPTLLPDGAMLVFDNQGNGGLSRVLELDPFSQAIRWAYDGTEENGFFSGTLGAAHRLANGNTLIVESEAGRAFEVTPELEVVWSFFNPARGGDDDELVAALYDVVRVPAAFTNSWLVLEADASEVPR